MEDIGLLLVGIGQTLAVIGALVVTVTAYTRARKPSEARVTWATIYGLDRYVDRRIAQDAIGWGASTILVGLAGAAIGAWLLLLA